eukprot:4086743-Amphidinium_carterae.1
MATLIPGIGLGVGLGLGVLVAGAVAAACFNRSKQQEVPHSKHLLMTMNNIVQQFLKCSVAS